MRVASCVKRLGNDGHGKLWLTSALLVQSPRLNAGTANLQLLCGGENSGSFKRAKDKFTIKANELRPDKQAFIGACAQPPHHCAYASYAPGRLLSAF